VELKTQHGYLLIADISGYTSFLAGTELEHAQDILAALLETIVTQFQSRLTISKIEGDAVFAYVLDSNLPRGETLLELIERTYLAFRDHVDVAFRNTTCRCKACSAIPTLDLKFVAHFGDFVVQNVAGIRELVGSDVNLVHRLLKNHVYEATGWKAYILFTNQTLEHMNLRPDCLQKQMESYEHFGKVETYVMDMHQRHKELKESQRIFLTAEESDAVIVYDLPAPPLEVWDWINAPTKRVLWSGFNEFKVVRGSDGRTGSGTQSHCIHDARVLNSEVILDWHPFDYWTQDANTGPTRQTYRIEPLEDGRRSRLHLHIKGKMRWPRFIRKPFMGIVKRMIEKSMKDLEDAIRQEQRQAVTTTE
jgi:class 3 adenylate cyclase